MLADAVHTAEYNGKATVFGYWVNDPERLGLAQLHQLRGRVGRGAVASHCVLLYKTPLSKTCLLYTSHCKAYGASCCRNEPLRRI